MIGPRCGAKAGPMGGVRVGSGTDELAPQGAAGSTTQTIALTDSGTVNGGAALTYAAAYANTGTLSATSVSVAVTLDAKLTYVSASGTGWSCSQSGGVVTCTRATAAVGAAPSITIVATAPNDGTTSVTSSAAATASNATTAHSGNDTTTVTPQTTQTVSVTPSVSNILANGPNFTLTVQYTNTGSSNASSVSVATTLDASLTYVSASGTGWSISQSGGVVTATMSSAAPGAANAIVITATPGSAASTSSAAAATASNASTANGSGAVSVLACSKDATSGIYCPASAAEWAHVLTVAGIVSGGPSFLWLCQETSGNLADSIGGVTLTAANSPGYAGSVAGWSRKGVTFPTDGSNAKFTSTSASLPDISTTSFLLIAYVAVTGSSTSNRNVISMGTTISSVEITSAQKMRVVSGANVASAPANTIPTTVVPFVLKNDHTNGVTAGYSLQDKVIPTFGTTQTGKEVYIGNASGSDVPMTCLYMVGLTGSAAELSDADIKLIDQTLGYAPSWP